MTQLAIGLTDTKLTRYHYWAKNTLENIEKEQIHDLSVMTCRLSWEFDVCICHKHTFTRQLPFCLFPFHLLFFIPILFTQFLRVIPISSTSYLIYMTKVWTNTVQIHIQCWTRCTKLCSQVWSESTLDDLPDCHISIQNRRGWIIRETGTPKGQN